MPAPHLLANRFAPLALILAFAACDEPPSGPPTGAVPAELRVMGGDGQLATVGATLPDELVVAAVDAAGRPIPGVGIQFAVVVGGGQVAPQTVTADGQGFARTRWTLGTVAADSQVVEARVGSLPALRLRARVRPDAPAALAISGGGAAGQVGAPLADSLAVTVKDRYGNPVGGVEVVWEVAAGGGAVSPARSATRADGMAKAQWTLGPRVDSAQAVQLRVGTLDPVAFTANAVTAGIPLQLAKRGGDGQRGPAGGVLADSLGVVLRMPDGRPVQGAIVTWSVPASAGTVTPAVSRTDANGAASAVWRLGTGAGLVQATATVDEGTLIFTALTEAAAAAEIVAVAGGGEGPVGGAMADSLAVRVTDAYGNPVPGTEIAWAAASGSGTVHPAVSTTDAQGIARAQWVLGLRVGTPAQSAAATLGSLPPVAFQATATTRGVPLQLARTGGEGQTGAVGSVLADSLTVQLRTQAGEPVQGATVVWAVTSGGGAISPATVRTDAQGRARTAWVLGTTPGAAGASAQVDEGALAFSATAQVGPPAAVQATAGDGQSTTRGTILPDSLEVRVVDAYGNPVSGAQVQWSVLTGGGHVEQSTTTTGADGRTRTWWAVGFTPGPNTARAAVDGAGAAQLSATSAPGTLILDAGWDGYRLEGEECVGGYAEVDVYVHVTDEGGRPVVGAALTSEGVYDMRDTAAWGTSWVGHANAYFLRYNYEIEFEIGGWVQFEDQRDTIVIQNFYICPDYPPPDEESGDTTPDPRVAVVSSRPGDPRRALRPAEGAAP